MIPLINQNLLLLHKTKSNLVSELSIFERAAYQQNEQQINTILTTLNKYIDPSAVTKYANILGIPFQSFGEEDSSDLTPTVLMDTIYKALEEQQKTTDQFLLAAKPDLPNIIDSLEGMEVSQMVAEALGTKEEDGEETAVKKKHITVDDTAKSKGHRSLFDDSKYVEDDTEFTDYTVEINKDKEVDTSDETFKSQLELPSKDFLEKGDKNEQALDDELY